MELLFKHHSQAEMFFNDLIASVSTNPASFDIDSILRELVTYDPERQVFVLDISSGLLWFTIDKYSKYYQTCSSQRIPDTRKIALEI